MGEIQAGISEQDFEQAFKSHFKSLHAYACSILREESAAEEIVQHVFYKLWEKRDKINITQSLTAYLYRAVYNESMNLIKHNKVKDTYAGYVKYSNSKGENVSEKIIADELETRIIEAVNSLPSKCRAIFQLSRFEELKYREIADKMQLSVKTVENQMGKALKILREKLALYLPSLLLVISTINF